MEGLRRNSVGVCSRVLEERNELLRTLTGD